MAGLEVRAPLGIAVLQEIFIPALTKFHLADLVALLAEHYVFLRITLRGALRAVEAREQLSAIADLAVGGSLKGCRHDVKATGFRCRVQGISRADPWGRAHAYITRTRLRARTRPRCLL